MPQISDMCQLVHTHIQDNYVNTYASYEPNAINNVTRNTDIHTSHYCHMPLNKYTCDIAHICPTALILWSTFRPLSTVHTSPPKTVCNILWEIIAKYDRETNVPSNAIDMSHMQRVHMQIQDNYYTIYTYMDLMQSTVWPGALLYIISHYWHMPLNKYACQMSCISHCMKTVFYMYTPH